MSKPQDDALKTSAEANADEDTQLELERLEKSGEKPSGLKIAVNRPIAMDSLVTPQHRQMSRIANQATQVGSAGGAPLPKRPSVEKPAEPPAQRPPPVAPSRKPSK